MGIQQYLNNNYSYTVCFYINTDRVQLFDLLFLTPPQANHNNCNSICSPRSIIHLLRQVKLIGKSGELHWEDYQLTTTLLLTVGTNA